LSLAGGLLAQPAVNVTIKGAMGPYLSGSGFITDGGKYVSGVTATGAYPQYCVVAYSGPGSGATAKLYLGSTPGTNPVPAQTIGTGKQLLTPGSGYSYASPPATGTVTNGTATNCTGTATFLTMAGGCGGPAPAPPCVKVDDPVGLIGQTFTATTTLDPVGVTYNASTYTYSSVPITFIAGIASLSCNATAVVTLNDSTDGGNDTLSLSCTFSAGAGATFASKIAFPPNSLPGTMPLPLAQPVSIVGSPTSQLTYMPLPGSGIGSNDVTTLGISSGTYASVCGTGATACPSLNSVSPLSFTAVQGGSAPPPQSVTVNTSTEANEAYVVTSGANWLTFSSGGATTTGGQIGGSFNVYVNPAATGLVLGLNKGTLNIYTAASNSPLQVEVDFTLTPPAPPSMVPPVSPPAFTSNAGAVPGNQTLTVTSSNSTVISYSAAASTNLGGNWLAVSPSSGSTSGSETVSINASALSGLATGTYTGQVVFTCTPTTSCANASGQLSVPVSLTVTAALVAPPTVTFNYTIGGSTPGSQGISVTSNGGAITYTAVAASGVNWLAVSPASPTQVTTPTGVTASVNAAALSGLTGGTTYPGTITLTPTVGGDSPATINASLVVAAEPALQVSPGSLTFNMVATGSLPAAQGLTVSASNSASIPFNIATATTSGGNWLSAPATGNTSSGNISVSILANSLAPGTYNGTVTFSSAQATSVVANIQLIVNTISLSPSPLTFNYQLSSGQNPAPQNLTVASGLTPPVNLSFTAQASVTTPSGGNWLSVTPGGGTTPLGLTVTATPGSLGAGSYSGTITVSSGGASFTVPVTLAISTLPSLTTTPNTLPFNFTILGSLPASQTVTVGSNGTALSGVSASTSTPWLTIVSQSGTATPFTLTVGLNAAGLASLTPGPYTGSITITAQAGTASNSPLSYPVTLTVSAANALTANPSPINLTYTLGGTAPTATLNVGSTVAGLSFTAASGASWLTVAPGGGTTPQALNVSIVTTGLTAQTYHSNITLTAASAGNSPLTVPVNLTVNSMPSLTVNPTMLSFGYTTGAAAPTGQSVAVGTSNGASTAFSVSATTMSGGNWLQVPAGGTSPASFLVNIVPGSLTAGTYHGTVTVSATGYTPAAVAVTLVVTQPKAVIQVTGSTLFILPNTAAPATSTLAIAASDGSAQAFTIAASSSQYNWLKLSATSGTTPANVTLTANPAGLIPGIYVTSITVTMPGLPVPTKTLEAELTVSGSNLAASPGMLTFTYTPGAVPPAPQTVSLTTVSGSGTVALASVGTDVAWLSVSPASIAPAMLQVSVRPGLVTAGTYNGDVIVKGVGSPDASLQIPVTITVTAAAQLTATPATLAFNYQTGDAAPAAQSFAVTSGNGQVNFTATSPGNWLQVSPQHGATPGSVLVTANPAGLTAGTYGGKIKVTDTTGAAPATVAVTLTITGSAQLTIAPGQLFFAAAVGGPAPAPKMLAVTSGGVPVNFTAAPGSAWLGVTPTSGTTSATLAVSVIPAGLAVGTYNGTINITQAGSAAVAQMILVTLQVGSGGPTPTIAGAINAASGAAGTVAPGMAISIFGASLGPQTGVGFAAPPAGGTVATTLAGTDVLFDGNPVPVLYTSNGQVNALAPFELAGKNTVVQVVYNGVTSAGMTLPVVAAEPGLFAADGTGKGQGAILDQNYNVNSAAKPAPAGTTVMLYGTGGGVTVPPSTDGALNPMPPPLGALALTATATVGGQTANVLYAGPAPGLVAGVFQINVTIPSGTPSGNAPVVVKIGNALSQTVTVAVQ